MKKKLSYLYIIFSQNRYFSQNAHTHLRIYNKKHNKSQTKTQNISSSKKKIHPEKTLKPKTTPLLFAINIKNTKFIRSSMWEVTARGGVGHQPFGRRLARVRKSVLNFLILWQFRVWRRSYKAAVARPGAHLTPGRSPRGRAPPGPFTASRLRAP